MMKKLLCAFILLITTVGFVQAQEIDVQGNGISIVGDGTNTPGIADDTDFGQITPGTSSSEHTFTVLNTGVNPLTIFISATTDPIFSITTSESSPVPGGSSTTIGVTYNAPLTPGITNAQLLIFSNDVDEGAYQINIRGESLAPLGPEMDVFGNGISIAGDGSNIPATADGTNFGQITTGNSSTEQFYVIQNNGTAPLTVDPSFITDPNFVITTAAVSPIASGGSATIGVTFNAPVGLGIYNGTLLIPNNDSDENPYQINLQAESAAVVGPEIDVLGNGISIIGDGTNTPNIADDTDFGQIAPGASSTEHVFTIQNTGTSPLTINSFFTTNTPVFTITTGPVSPIPAGGSTTIGVTFNAPLATGIIGATLLIFNTDSDEGLYQINLQGESFIATFPEIDVLGNAISIIGDGTNIPNVADGTDFGTVVTGNSSTEQVFTIQNTGGAPLSISSTNLTNPNFVITTAAVSPVPIGGSTTIGITFNAPVTLGVSNAILIIGNDDSDENPYQINITAESIPVAGSEMDIFGNGVEIADGDITPDVTDDTDFGQADVTLGSVSHTFTIENNGGSDLNLTDPDPFVIITGDVGDFTVNARPAFPIVAGGSSTFVIEFNPTALGIRTATVSIGNNDSDENPYTFAIQGEGIDANADSPLLITQYYEGNANDQWIEVKNISQSTVIAGQYFLALYTNFNTLSGTINSIAPDANVSIGTMAPDAVRIFRNPSALLPSSGNLGGAPVTSTSVCTFDGNDVILISTNNGVTCYNNRTDIMGIVDAVTPRIWGRDKGFIKGCGTNEQPSTTFDATIGPPIVVNDYIEMTIDEVNNANVLTNIALGTQGVGVTTWNGTAWDNETPGRTRQAIINGTYTASNGTFEACDLTIAGDLNFDNGTNNYVEIHNDLTIGGTFTIGDTESLFFDEDNEDAIIIGSITKIESSTSLININDFTYWSSPVQGATIGSVFSNADISRVFYWDQSAANTVPGGDVGDPTIVFGEWLNASGTMLRAKGYISEGPTGGSYPQVHTVSFTGTPSNGVLSIAGSPHMVFNNDGNAYSDYNLIGNPYPSAIDADELIGLVDNSTIDGTLWFWTHNTQNNGNSIYQYTTDDYASYNLSGGVAAGTGGAVPTGNIGSGQGFMVRAITTGPGVIFNNAMRLRDQNTQFFRGTETKNNVAEEKNRIWINAESSEGGAFNQILIGFFENATDEYDRGYDGLKLGSNWVSLYSKIDTLGYAIQGLGSFSLDKKVTLGFDTYISTPLTYKISIHKIEGVLKDNDVYLVDNLLNITHDLKLADYEFDVDGVGYFSDRFTLQFTKSTLGIDDLELDNNFIVINEENALRLRSSAMITNLKVYDISGRLLIDKKPNDSEFIINTEKIGQGTVLILNATFENGAEASKKAIRY